MCHSKGTYESYRELENDISNLWKWEWGRISKDQNEGGEAVSSSDIWRRVSAESGRSKAQTEYDRSWADAWCTKDGKLLYQPMFHLRNRATRMYTHTTHAHTFILRNRLYSHWGWPAKSEICRASWIVLSRNWPQVEFFFFSSVLVHSNYPA